MRVLSTQGPSMYRHAWLVADRKDVKPKPTRRRKRSGPVKLNSFHAWTAMHVSGRKTTSQDVAQYHEDMKTKKREYQALATSLRERPRKKRRTDPDSWAMHKARSSSKRLGSRWCPKAARLRIQQSRDGFLQQKFWQMVLDRRQAKAAKRAEQKASEETFRRHLVRPSLFPPEIHPFLRSWEIQPPSFCNSSNVKFFQHSWYAGAVRQAARAETQCMPRKTDLLAKWEAQHAVYQPQKVVGLPAETVQERKARRVRQDGEKLTEDAAAKCRALMAHVLGFAKGTAKNPSQERLWVDRAQIVWRLAHEDEEQWVQIAWLAWDRPLRIAFVRLDGYQSVPNSADRMVLCPSRSPQRPGELSVMSLQHLCNALPKSLDWKLEFWFLEGVRPCVDEPCLLDVKRISGTASTYRALLLTPEAAIDLAATEDVEDDQKSMPASKTMPHRAAQTAAAEENPDATQTLVQISDTASVLQTIKRSKKGLLG